MDSYQNEHLDRAIALIVVIVFFVALFYALMVIGQFWQFFRWFFCGIVVLLSVWIVAMLFNVIWRYNARTQVILENGNIPLQLSQKITSPIIENPTPSYVETHNYPDGFFDDEEDY
jgi:nitrogen fixation/metabolism regulation signal transduction histidine kinase